MIYHSPFSIFHSKGGGDRIRTYSAVKQQIYSLPRLSNFGAPPSISDLGFRLLFYKSENRNPTSEIRQRASRGTRTPDQLITNQLLYQLSYTGMKFLIF